MIWIAGIVILLACLVLPGAWGRHVLNKYNRPADRYRSSGTGGELARHLLDRHRARLGVHVEHIAPDTMELLLDYPWPGNVRELENILERAMVLADGDTLGTSDLPEHVRVPSPNSNFPDMGDDLSVKRRTAELERHLIQRALDRTEGNKTRAAELLELSPRALRYKLHDYGLKD